MANDAKFTADESRQLAVVIARAWADPDLADAYRRDPGAVLRGAGIDIGGRDAPSLPDKPGDLGAIPASENMAMSSSASSISCATCPCSGCTASCACCTGVKAEISDPQMEAMMRLADDPAGREAARNLMAKWDVSVGKARVG